MRSLSKIVLIACTFLIGLSVFAGIEPVNNRVQGEELYFLKGSPSTLDIADNKYWMMADGFWDTEFTVKSVQNQITLGIDESDMTFHGTGFAYRVELNISFKQLVGLTLVDRTIEGIELEIDYNPARGTTYRDRSVFSFSGGLDVQAEVVTIEKFVGASWEEVITNSLPTSLFLETEIRTERYYPFDQSLVPSSSTSLSLIPGEIKVAWPYIEGAEEYELEWTWVNSYSGEVTGVGPTLLETSAVNYDFGLNSTRVRLQGKNTYTIPLIYGDGYILVRYRGIGRGGSDFSIPLEGKWNSDAIGLSGSKGIVSGFGTSGVNFITVTAHESNEINYGAGMSFIEDGVRSVGVTYMDGVLKARQSQAALNSQDKIIAGSTIYDHYGRPAIGVMSTPVDQSTLGYIDNLNMHTDGTPYGKQHFDLDDPELECGIYTAAPPMSSTLSSGAANFYSEDNPDQQGPNAYLPDAKGYPFVQVEYSDDPTGRITRVGGLGPDHQLGETEVDEDTRNAHYTEYFYSTVDDAEVYALFGNDAAAPSNYTKVITKDVHGQLSIAIIDPMGRTIVTYMAGNAPSGLEKIIGFNDDGSPVSKNLMDYNLVDEMDGVLEVNHPHFVEDPEVIYEFNYDFTAVNFSDCLLPTIDLCFDCIYDIEIIIICEDKDCEIEDGDANVISEDGVAQFSYTVGSIEAFDPSSCNESPFTFSGVNGIDAATFNVKFPKVGTYQIIKRLTVSKTPLDYYWELYKKNSTCLLSESFFINEALTYIDPSDCDDIGPCELSFLLEYGTLAIYLEANPESNETEYNILFDDYRENCETKNSCDFLGPILINDFKAGGQYSIKDLIIADDDGDLYSGELLDAIFEMHVGGIAEWRDLGPFYEIDGVTESVIIDELGVEHSSPYTGITLVEFANNWKNSWAENFIHLHPEYCYYTFCGEYPGIFEYENDLNSVETFAEACSLGLVNPFPSGYGSLAGCTSEEDPIYAGGLTSPIIDILTEDYDLGIAGVLDIYEYAVHVCGDDYTTIAFGTGCNADRHWKAFRSLYLSKRFRIIDQLKKTYVDGAGCSDYARSVGTTEGPEGDNVFSTRTPRQLTYETFFFDLDPLFDWDAEMDDAEDEIELACLEQCEGLADSWMAQLAGCVDYLPVGETWESGQTTFDLVKSKLIEVCAGGCDAEWPFPLQVDDATLTNITDPLKVNWTFHSFEDVITNLLGAETVECSHLLITNPLPSDGTESLITNLDDCSCNMLLSTTDLDDFIATYGFEPYDYAAERCKCDAIDAAGNNNDNIDGAEVAALAAAAIFTPNTYLCSTSCIDCSQMSIYQAGFNTTYSETYLTEPLLFTAYINEVSGGNYSYAQMVELIENCIAIAVLNESVPIYHLLDHKTVEIRDLLNKLNLVGITNDQEDRTLLSLPEYLNSSLYPCGDEDVATYDYEPTVGATTIEFDLTNEDCTGACTFTLSVPDGVPAGFASTTEVFENIVSFGEIYMLTALYFIDLKYFYTTTVVNVPGGGTVTIPIRIDNTCYDFITEHLTANQGNPSFIICTDDVEGEETPCLDNLIAEAELTGHENYLEYLAAKEAEFKQDYIIACSAVNETFTVDYMSNRYHYTLLYYDQSGNLAKTVPPSGVNPLSDAQIEDVIECVEHDGDPLYPPVYPTHSFETTYKQNSLNQVIEVSTPDGGTNHYFYDNLGRLVVSQNSKQAVFKRGIITGDYTGGDEIPAYSYTRYDELGRVIEVGEISHPTAMTKAIAKNPTLLQAWFDVTYVLPENVPVIRNNITLMYYDEGYSVEASTEFGAYGYGYTRNRITATAVISGYVNPVGLAWVYPEPDYINHYKYDIHGNVQTYLQEINDLTEFGNQFRRVDYDYDLISGNPNYIYYQKGKVDQYIHHYIYDKDNRLKEVFTSDKGQIWDRDVNYEYREDGYLARTEIGEMKVQGMDYAFTLHGWLKSLNSGVLNAEYDMGRDGRRDGATEYSSLENEVHALVAKDALAYTIGYYENDYQAVSQGTSDFENMQITIPGESAFYADRTNLYNGNITSLITSLTDYEGNKLGVNANTYHYDQLHRFKEMHVFTASTPGGISATNSLASATRKNLQSFSITEYDATAGTRNLGDYEVHVDYDRNGNITHLIRMSQSITGEDITTSTITDNGMDEFSYIYEASTNKLTQVTDNNDNQVLTVGGSPVDFGDIKSGQGTDNYVYHPDGSLKSDLDEEIAYIDWYPSGKIKQIYRTITSEQSDLYFEYDPMGIRTLKVEMTRTGTTLNDPEYWKYTYYASAASGTTLAIYELDENDQDNTLRKTETMIYGGSRLGIDVNPVTVSGSQTKAPPCEGESGGSFIFEVVGPSNPVSWLDEDVTISFDGIVIADISDWTSPDYSVLEIIDDINSSVLNLEAFLISGVIDGGSYIARIKVVETVPGTFSEGTLTVFDTDERVTITEIQPFTECDCYSSRVLGLKYYEISNHLGNVMEVVSDRKIAVDENTYSPSTGGYVSSTSDGIIDWFEADVVQYSDYYPYGMTMPGRNGSISEKYRYAFNGMETDKEVSGSGNSYTTQFRQYDPRLGRWKSLDPLMYMFVSVSPYSAFGNNPIVFTDPYGLAPMHKGNGNDKGEQENDAIEINSVEEMEGYLVDKAANGDVDNTYFVKGGISYKAIYNADSGGWEVHTKFTIHNDAEYCEAPAYRYNAPRKESSSVTTQAPVESTPPVESVPAVETGSDNDKGWRKPLIVADDVASIAGGATMIKYNIRTGVPYTVRGGTVSSNLYTIDSQGNKTPMYRANSGKPKTLQGGAYDSFKAGKLVRNLSTFGKAGDVVQGVFIIKDLINDPSNLDVWQDAAWAAADMISDRLLMTGNPYLVVGAVTYKAVRYIVVILMSEPTPSNFIPPSKEDLRPNTIGNGSDRMIKEKWQPQVPN